MAVEFRLPDLGEGITEGELVRWLVKPGDRVALDQAIAEVQTDKAVVELPAPVAGAILTLDVAEGQLVPTGTLLLTIAESAPTSATTSAPPMAAPAAPPMAAPSTPASATSPVPTSAGASGERVVSAEIARAEAQAEPAAVQTAPAAGGAATNGAGRWDAASVAPQRRALATPAVRRLARELGLDIAAVHGSGPAGRVLAEDLRAAPVAPTTPEAPAAQREGVAAGSGAEPAPRVTMPGEAGEGPEEERLPLRGLRRRIAENMVRSVSTIPQVTSLVEVDASALVALRRSVLPTAEARGLKLSYLPFIAKALVQALRAYPYINAAIDDATHEIVLKRRYHIGIATATPDGLLVPVLRHADRLTVLEIAAELARLAEAGRARTLALDELRGSTFTISNYGTVGGFFATPIINPGEAAILGLGRIAERPWAVDGRVEARPVLPLSFTADHRLIDGELAMRFLNTLISMLENPNLLLLEMR